MTKTVRNLIIAASILFVAEIAVNMNATPLTNPEHPVVNINAASPHQLAMLPGVGAMIAYGIAARCAAAHPCKGASDLLDVRGIGAKRLAGMSPYVVTEGPTTAVTKIRIRIKKGTR